MAIYEEGDWMYAEGPEDLDEWIRMDCDRYPINEILHGVCEGCGGTVFAVHGNIDDGIYKGDVQWTCRACGRVQLVPGCVPSWLPIEPKPGWCDCQSNDHHVAAAYSADASGEVFFISMVQRCTSCDLVCTFNAKRLRPGNGFRLPTVTVQP